jgi:hypothetical protein
MSTEPRIIPVGAELAPLAPAAAPDRSGAERKPQGVAPPEGGRFGVLNSFVDVTLRRVGPTAAIVWFVLFRDAKPDGLARTAQTDIARRIGKTSRTVRSAVRKLEQLGLLMVVRRGRLNVGATVYRVRSQGAMSRPTGNPLPVDSGNLLPKQRKRASGIPERDQKAAAPAGAGPPAENA